MAVIKKYVIFDRNTWNDAYVNNKKVIYIPSLGMIKFRDAQHLPAIAPEMITVARNAAGHFHLTFVNKDPKSHTNQKLSNPNHHVLPMEALMNTNTTIRTPDEQHDLDEELAEAAFDGRTADVVAALNKGANPKYNKSEPLYWAAKRGALDAVQVLAPLSDHLDDAADHAGDTLCEEVVMYLLPLFLDEHYPAGKSNQMFMRMLSLDRTSAMQLLWDGGKIDINHSDGEFLRRAAERGHVDHVVWLLDKGADLSLKQFGALRTAGVEGHVEVTRILMARMSDDQIALVSQQLDQIRCLDGRKQQFENLWQARSIEASLDGMKPAAARRASKI